MGLTDWTAGAVWATAITTWAAAASAWAAGTSWAGDGGDGVAAQQALSISTTVSNIADPVIFNPYHDDTYASYAFDTNYDTGDITYTEADGKFTFDAGGVFMVDLSTVMGTTASNNNDQALNLSGSPVWAPATNMRTNSVVMPTEVAVSLILAPTAGQFLEYFVDAIGSGNFNAHVGSTVTLTEVPDITGDPDVHLVCVSCNDSSNVNASAIFPFNEGFYPVTGTFKIHTINGIEYTPVDGKMTIKRAATYLIDIVIFDVIGDMSVAAFSIRLLKNGSPIWQPTDNRHHHATDPFPRPITLQLTLDVDDVLTLEIDSQDANTSGTKPGTSWSIIEMAA